MFITSKQIKPESSCYSDVKAFWIFYRTWPAGTFLLDLFRNYDRTNAGYDRTYANLPYQWQIWMNCVCIYTTSKPIKLDSPVAQGLKLFRFSSKPDQLGLSSFICLEAI